MNIPGEVENGICLKCLGARFSAVDARNQYANLTKHTRGKSLDWNPPNNEEELTQHRRTQTTESHHGFRHIGEALQPPQSQAGKRNAAETFKSPLRRPSSPLNSKHKNLTPPRSSRYNSLPPSSSYHLGSHSSADNRSVGETSFEMSLNLSNPALGFGHNESAEELGFEEQMKLALHISVNDNLSLSPHDEDSAEKLSAKEETKRASSPISIHKPKE